MGRLLQKVSGDMDLTSSSQRETVTVLGQPVQQEQLPPGLEFSVWLWERHSHCGVLGMETIHLLPEEKLSPPGSDLTFLVSTSKGSGVGVLAF